MQRRLLNIIPDEKFTPFVQGIFLEAAPEMACFRIVTSRSKPIHASANAISEVVPNAYLLSSRFRQEAREASCVVFHGMTPKYALAALTIPPEVPIAWRGWGYDYYPFLVESEADLLLPETRQLDARSFMEGLPHSPKMMVHRIAEQTIAPYAMRRLIARLKFFSCCVPDDFAALSKSLPAFSASFFPLNYYSCEDIFLRGDASEMTGPNILVGNSATPENNHAEVLRHLASLRLGQRKVIVPLGYGDPLYKERIKRLGQATLGDAFVSLDGFLPLDEYNRVIKSCGTVIMNHRRQQGIGNVSAALLRGAKVFLRADNSIFAWYRRRAVRVHSYPEAFTQAMLDASLESVDKTANARVMTDIWARRQALDQVRGFVATIQPDLYKANSQAADAAVSNVPGR